MNLYIAYYLTPAPLDEDAGEDDIKILGLYSTKERAEQAVRSASTQPGFVKGLGKFLVHPWPLDQKQWVDGLVTWGEALAELRRSEK